MMEDGSVTVETTEDPLWIRVVVELKACGTMTEECESMSFVFMDYSNTP